ncbi:methylmalonyl Co-A mutase-associated GTPase MeaB [Anaerolinea thermophila]|uniref:methylmalonyl Co-A mutase-associated GTPase MeaB n=1 Tax=Anaerolinea thermophila TaxID=167964 RepID=UPI0026EAF1F1|nr:methylmalonyl Co-A mutase-associated GTPase MeaB [Anaerolinea thermophila]
MDLVERALAGERLAIARLLTQVENNTSFGQEALQRLYPRTGNAHIVGLTGAPGTGKSSLANQLAKAIRSRQDAPKVAIVAVDPSSPFTGGALLGDRVRMRDLAGDSGVFVRSMASRGALGGVARATSAIVQVLDALGFGMILVETVGTGQSEVEVARLAHTVIVVDAPGLGDDVQAIKAGILEIADILVVNKADLPGVENTLRALNLMLEMFPQTREQNGWKPPLLRASAVNGEGIVEIIDAIFRHGEYLKTHSLWTTRERSRVLTEILERVQEILLEHWKHQVGETRLNQVVERVLQRELSPAEAVKYLLD